MASSFSTWLKKEVHIACEAGAWFEDVSSPSYKLVRPALIPPSLIVVCPAGQSTDGSRIVTAPLDVSFASCEQCFHPCFMFHRMSHSTVRICLTQKKGIIAAHAEIDAAWERLASLLLWE